MRLFVFVFYFIITQFVYAVEGDFNELKIPFDTIKDDFLEILISKGYCWVKEVTYGS